MRLDKLETIFHVKEEPLEPLHRDPAHLHVNTTLGMNLPPAHLNARLNILLGPPPVTGRLVGGMRALPAGKLVGQGTPILTLHNPGTKKRDNAKACTLFYALALSSSLGSHLGPACLVFWWTSSAALLALLFRSLLTWFFHLLFTLALAFTLV